MLLAYEVKQEILYLILTYRLFFRCVTCFRENPGKSNHRIKALTFFEEFYFS